MVLEEWKTMKEEWKARWQGARSEGKVILRWEVWTSSWGHKGSISLFLNQGNGIIRLAYVENHYGFSMKRGLAGWQDEIQDNLLERRWWPGIRQMAMERRSRNGLEVGWAEELEKEQQEMNPYFWLTHVSLWGRAPRSGKGDEFICGHTEFCYPWVIKNITCLNS